jgi:hypothetical protein
VLDGKQRHDAIKVYACGRRRDRGGTVCPSILRREIGLIDSAVVNWVRERVLTESYVSDVIAEACRCIEERASAHGAESEELAQQAQKLRGEVDKFAELALEAPADARGIFFAKVSERQKQLTDIESRLRAARTVPAAMDFELRQMEREALERLEKLTEAVERNPAETRAFMKALFPKGLTAKRLDQATGRGVSLEGVATPNRAFGVRVGNSASPGDAFS